MGQAAKDWPQLNFVIYHSAYRHVGGDPKQALAEFERIGRISWTSDLADIPAQYGVNNVYGDVGQLFALATKPLATGSMIWTTTIGIERVSRCTTDVASVPATSIASGCRLTKSAAWALRPVGSPELQRTSMRTFRPFFQPSCASPSTKADNHDCPFRSAGSER